MVSRWFAFLPNFITLARLVLTPAAIVMIAEDRWRTAFLIFVVAGVSDALDGWLAKTFGWTSRLGGILDPLADKLLVATVIVTLVVVGLVPLWLALVAILRDVVIIAGATAYHFVVGHLEARPTTVSKLNTLVQLSFVLIVIARAAWPGVPNALVIALGAATVCTTVVSGLDYVITYARLAWRLTRPAAGAAG
jgi:cardiolipin synthase